MDLRFGVPLADTKTCGVKPEIDNLAGVGEALLAPNAPEKSVISLRMRATGAKRMPPVGTRLVHAEGTNLVDEWIRNVKVCQ